MRPHFRPRDPHAVVESRSDAARAFTLFEVVLVILILGIVAAALAVPLGGNLYASRLRTAAAVLGSDIDYCASGSVAQPNAPGAVTFDTTRNQYSLIDYHSKATLKYPADSQDYVNDFATGRNAQWGGVTLQSVLCGGRQVGGVAFDAYGRPTAYDAAWQSLPAGDVVITLAFNGQTLTVTISCTTGDVTITGT